MDNMMRAVTYCSNSDEFILKNILVPVPSSEDLLIKVEACGLNPVDAKINLWHSMSQEMDNDFTAGLDVSGVVIKVGDQVKGFKIGDKVLYHGDMLRKHGGFAEYALQNYKTVIKHPKVDAISAAALPCSGWTAYRALFDKLKIKRGESLFIAGGSGGVGMFAIQLAKLLGATPIITSCSEKNHSFVKQLGADFAIDYKMHSVHDEVMDITQNLGVDKALDCVGGRNVKLCANLLAFEGEMLELVDVVEPINYDQAFLKGLSFHQLSLGSGHRFGEKGIKRLVDSASVCSTALEKGFIHVGELSVISLDEVPKALYDIRKQRTVGKIVVKI